MSPHSHRIDAAVRAVTLARRRATVHDLASRRVMAEAIALMRAEGLSDRRIADVLGVSKSSIRALSAVPEADASETDQQADNLKHHVWVEISGLAARGYIVDGDDMASHERMAVHGIVPTLVHSLDRADTIAREYLQVTTGERVLVYSQTRWNGNPDPAASTGWDQRGNYLVERCPGLEPGICAAGHMPVPLEELGLRPDDTLYGSGWTERRPTAHQVWKLLTAAIEEAYEVFDPTYPELELRRRPGTTPRYGSTPKVAASEQAPADRRNR